MKGRDIYFDFASFAPGSQVKTFEELLSEVDRFLQGEAGSQHEHSGEKRREFCEYFLDSLDGHSTERILAYIRELCMGGVGHEPFTGHGVNSKWIVDEKWGI